MSKNNFPLPSYDYIKSVEEYEIPLESTAHNAHYLMCGKTLIISGALALMDFLNNLHQLTPWLVGVRNKVELASNLLS